MKVEGLDKAIRKLDDLQNRAQQLDGSHNVPISELLTPSFMQRHTTFVTFDAMLSASGFEVETAEDFKAIPDDQWDAFIEKGTRFSSWQDMINEAGKEWTIKELGG